MWYIIALMHAYFSGNASLCDALIRNGAHPNTMNKQGVTIFNAPVATKQLLFRILSKLHVVLGDIMILSNIVIFPSDIVFKLQYRHIVFQNLKFLCI